jgi:hypothetical protein
MTGDLFSSFAGGTNAEGNDLSVKGATGHVGTP